MATSKRGFASMDSNKQREIAARADGPPMPKEQLTSSRQTKLEPPAARVERQSAAIAPTCRRSAAKAATVAVHALARPYREEPMSNRASNGR